MSAIIFSIRSCPCLERNESYGLGLLEWFLKLGDSGHFSGRLRGDILTSVTDKDMFSSTKKSDNIDYGWHTK